MFFEQLGTVLSHGNVVIRFAGKLWFEEGQSMTVWRIGSFGNTLWCDNGSRIWRFRSDAAKNVLE